MDSNIQKALHDKLYDKRKLGALDLERLVRDSLSSNNHAKIGRVIDQLCNDYAYAVHQPYARNGGLIGLAAASIALGPEVAPYLAKIVPPVLACFADQDARVRYYACESMYNIAKTSKGEILPFFNDVFDALAKLAADPELSVKNGAELLDRLIKDIISESATAYVSVLHEHKDISSDAGFDDDDDDDDSPETAFSLPRFIPLLKERIFVLNPFTRMFLVSWISLLDSIPDLELISYLPDFLGGLFRFLNDSNQDVVTSTQHVLEKFLEEIRLVAKVKRDLAENYKISTHPDAADPSSAAQPEGGTQSEEANEASKELSDEKQTENDAENQQLAPPADDQKSVGTEAASSTVNQEWIPGQDVHVDHRKILEILLDYLKEAKEEHIQLTALRWIDSFFEVCPEVILSFVPRLLNQVLPCLSSDIEQVRQAGQRVNGSLKRYIIAYTDEEDRSDVSPSRMPADPNKATSTKELSAPNKNEATVRPKGLPRQTDDSSTLASETAIIDDVPKAGSQLDYEASVNALTHQFLHENEATRVEALSWLIGLQSKAPKKVLAAHDGTFPALLKTLSDTSDAVVTRDLQLLSQISKNSADSYFAFFIVNLLKLFEADRRLLESRGNLIIRQLCLNLSPERIYRTVADCLEREEDTDFASTMVQNLNSNLITAPELSDLRRRLRNWESRDGQSLFVTLFRSWSHNAIATVSLCLLAQAYELAYSILQIFADLEMTVNMLIQIDKLVQLLESPVFTFLRLQLLEPERYPYLYKCLYGILMLLPQSAAFAALKNRLNSVSAIGYLHMPPAARPQPASASGPAFDRSSRIKTRDDGSIKWSELLERFKTQQDRGRRADSRSGSIVGSTDGDDAGGGPLGGGHKLVALSSVEGSQPRRPASVGEVARLPAAAASGVGAGAHASQAHKSRLSMTNIGRLAKGMKGPGQK